MKTGFLWIDNLIGDNYQLSTIQFFYPQALTSPIFQILLESHVLVYNSEIILFGDKTPFLIIISFLTDWQGDS